MTTELRDRFADLVLQASFGQALGGRTPANRQVIATTDGKGLPLAPVAPLRAGDAAELSSAVAELNAAIEADNRALRFSIDDASAHTVIQVINPDTDEVIRQIPAQEVLTLAAWLREGKAIHTTGLDEQA